MDVHKFTPGRGDGYFSDDEVAMMESTVTGPMASPGPDVAEEPEVEVQPQQAAGITRAEFLAFASEILDRLERMPAPVVNVSPTVELAPFDEVRETVVTRETDSKTLAGPKITGSKTVIRRIPTSK